MALAIKQRSPKTDKSKGDDKLRRKAKGKAKKPVLGGGSPPVF